jgi:hypothetical protein
MIWDEQARVWYCESDDIPGLFLESPSFDRLIERVREAAPEVLELNRAYTGPARLVFESVRAEMAKIS